MKELSLVVDEGLTGFYLTRRETQSIHKAMRYSVFAGGKDSDQHLLFLPTASPAERTMTLSSRLPVPLN
jgi:hypothetical protein